MAGESKRERRDRECGLTFSWRASDVSASGLCMATIFSVALMGLLLATVRVKVPPPPRVIERKASMVVMSPDSKIGRAWALRAEEEGPFPAKFDLASSPVVRDLQASMLLEMGSEIPYKSQLRNLSEMDDSAGWTPVSKEERVFPPLPDLQFDPPAPAGPLVPVLTVLSPLGKGAMVPVVPEWREKTSPQMAAQSWQFLVEIGENGSPLRCVSLDGVDVGSEVDRSLRDLGHWLCSVRFDPGVASGGWIGVDIHFSRKP